MFRCEVRRPWAIGCTDISEEKFRQVWREGSFYMQSGLGPHKLQANSLDGIDIGKSLLRNSPPHEHLVDTNDRACCV